MTPLQEALLNSKKIDLSLGTLRTNVENKGYRFSAKTNNDSNCFFHAVVDQLKRVGDTSTDDHIQLRTLGVNYLRKNRNQSDGSDRFWENYLTNMAKSGTWVDHVVVQATAEILERDIWVFTSTSESGGDFTIAEGMSRGDRPHLLLAHYGLKSYQSIENAVSRCENRVSNTDPPDIDEPIRNPSWENNFQSNTATKPNDKRIGEKLPSMAIRKLKDKTLKDAISFAKKKGTRSVTSETGERSYKSFMREVQVDDALQEELKTFGIYKLTIYYHHKAVSMQSKIYQIVSSFSAVNSGVQTEDENEGHADDESSEEEEEEEEEEAEEDESGQREEEEINEENMVLKIEKTQMVAIDVVMFFSAPGSGGYDEIFVLTSGRAHLLFPVELCDKTFASKIARRLLDFDTSSYVNTEHLTGPDRATTKLRRQGVATYVSVSDFLGSIMKNYTMSLRDKCLLYKFDEFRYKNGKPKNITFSIGSDNCSVKINMQMSLSDIQHTLSLFSRICKNEINRSLSSQDNKDDERFEILNHVQRIQDPRVIDELNENLNEEVVKLFHSLDNCRALSLVHKFTQKWSRAYKFVVLYRKSTEKKAKFIDLDEFEGKPPYVEEVIKSVIENHKEKGITMKDEEDRKETLDRLYIEYHFSGTKSKKEPFFSLIEGEFKTQEGTVAYRHAGKWMKIDYEYVSKIKKEAAEIIKSCRLLAEGFLPIPWIYCSANAPQEIKEKSSSRNRRTVKLKFESLSKWTGDDSDKDDTDSDSDTNTSDANVTSSTRVGTLEMCDRLPMSQPGQTSKQLNLIHTNSIYATAVSVSNAAKNGKSCNMNFDQFPMNSDASMDCQRVLFARIHCHQTEGLYNEGYILYDHILSHQNETMRYLLGDRILIEGKSVELFDILCSNSNSNETFLIHVKEGFANATRDVCSQIRISADLIFNEMTNSGPRSVLENIWNRVTKSVSKKAYRSVIRRIYEDFGMEDFKRLFSSKQKITYVLAYRDTHKRSGDTPQDDLIEKKQFREMFGFRCSDILKQLERAGFIHERSGGIFCATNKVFMNKTAAVKLMTSVGLSKPLTEQEAGEVYTILLDTVCQPPSFITSMELVQLYKHFQRYQRPGREKFELKICCLNKFLDWDTDP